jgi:hypothetical protein
MPRRHSPLNIPKHIRLLPLLHLLPKLRIHHPRTNQIDPHRLHIYRQIPDHAVQARGVRGYNAPSWDWLLGNASGGEHDAACGPGVQVARTDFCDEERCDEAELPCADDVLICGVLERDCGELIAGCEDAVDGGSEIV